MPGLSLVSDLSAQFTTPSMAEMMDAQQLRDSAYTGTVAAVATESNMAKPSVLGHNARSTHRTGHWLTTACTTNTSA